LDVTALNLPFDFTYTPGEGFAELSVRESSAAVALGRLTGTARLTTRGATRLKGDLRFAELDVQNLLRQFSDSGHLGAGKITGKADFWADNLQSINDLAANVDLKLRETQPKSMPVISQILASLGPMPSSSTYTSGDLRGRLWGGVFRIDRMSLAGGVVPLFITGVVTVQGRLDLDVLVHPQRTAASGGPLLRLLGVRIPAEGQIPTNLLTEATSLLAGRLIRLRVTGTIRSPTIQLQPIALLAEEALR